MITLQLIVTRALEPKHHVAPLSGLNVSTYHNAKDIMVHT